MLKVAVVILNWNGRKFLQKFLPSVLDHLPKYAEVFVADNNSTDDSVIFLKDNYSSVHLLINNENGGYAKGYNDALRKIQAEYYVLLNSDIEVTQYWIEPIIELMDEKQEITACQPKIRAYHDKEMFEYAGAGGGFIDKYGYPFCRGRIFQELEVDKEQYNDTIEVFWASGACMFVRAEHFWELNGLDNDFFAHMEEIDFCWRAKNNGYRIFYEPKSLVYHVGGGTLPKNNPHKTYLNFRNNFFLLYKNLESHRMFIVFFWRLLLDGVAGIKFFMDGQAKDSWAVLRAHFSFYASIPKLHKKRKALNQQKVGQIYQRNIVYEHFIRKIKSFDKLNSSKFIK